MDAVDDPGFEIDEKCTRYVVLVVSLIEENVFAVVALSGVLFENALSADAVLHAQLLPKFVSNCAHKVTQLARVKAASDLL